MKKIIFILLATIFTVSAHAIQYVKGSSKISAEEFDKCTAKIFRKSGQEELTPENRRQAVKDTLTGKAINDLEALKKHMTEHSDACSYGADSEKF